jgi:uncharacterized protein
MNHDAAFWIEKLNMQPHPEGGVFREVYRAPGKIPRSMLSADVAGDRSYSTAIQFLLRAGELSCFHRLRFDELWNFCEGEPLHLHILSPARGYDSIFLGPHAESGEVFVAVVPGGDWFAAEVGAADGYTLLSCTVAPGFEYADFEIARRSDLLREFPLHTGLITRLTR